MGVAVMEAAVAGALCVTHCARAPSSALRGCAGLQRPAAGAGARGRAGIGARAAALSRRRRRVSVCGAGGHSP